jgi:hypothetical protein
VDLYRSKEVVGVFVQTVRRMAAYRTTIHSKGKDHISGRLAMQTGSLFGSSISSGIQYEFESYIKNNPKELFIY